MERERLFAIEAARRCRGLLDAQPFWGAREELMDELDTLCQKVELNGASWSIPRLHRTVGYIQGVLVARGVSTFEEQEALMESLQIAFPDQRDTDLEDHNDPLSPFRLELGGSD